MKNWWMLPLVAMGIGFYLAQNGLVNLGSTSSPSRSQNTTNQNISGDRAEIQNIFSTRGSKAAYEYFLSKYQTKSDPSIHSLAHWVGNELFIRDGIKGVAICDVSFSYGCYHGFFGKALSQSGKELLPQAETACQKPDSPTARAGCIHGIGHGVMSLEGYANLVPSLKDCDLLLAEFSRKSCYNGALMEFNNRTMQGVNGEQVAMRPLNQDKPLDPCDQLEEKYRSDCFYEQPSWWSLSTNQDFPRLFKWCDLVTEPDSHQSCFRGIGRIIPFAVNYDNEKVGRVCLGISGKSDKDTCLEESLKALINDKGRVVDELCNLSDESFKTRCLQNAKIFKCQILKSCD